MIYTFINNMILFILGYKRERGYCGICSAFCNGRSVHTTMKIIKQIIIRIAL